MQHISALDEARISVTDDAAEGAAPNAHQRRKRRWGGGKLFACSVLVWLATWALLALMGGVFHASIWPCVLVGWAGFGASTVLALCGLVRGVRDALRARSSGEAPPDWWAILVLGIVGLGMTCVGLFSALIMTVGFSRGRQLRRRGRVLLPPVHAGSTWASSELEFEPRFTVPLGLGRQWRENGRTEHASVASFARLSLDLMALGAPPALLAAANRDALDEIRHTEACFGIARALDGQCHSPGAFPAAQSAHTLPQNRTLALATLAVSSLVDGALHEGVSARIIAKLARRCEVPAITQVLKQIAADEGRHAAHGWDVVEWCLQEGGPSVAHALLGALRSLPERMHSDLPSAAADGEWERWGIHGRALERAEYARTRAQVVERTRALALAALVAEPVQLAG
jgi:hypothetical protein